MAGPEDKEYFALCWNSWRLRHSGWAGGTMLGVAVSRLFIPYLQTGLATAQTIPPYVVRTSWDEFVVAAAILLGVICVLTIAVSVILARSNLFQVLKAGELEG